MVGDEMKGTTESAIMPAESAAMAGNEMTNENKFAVNTTGTLRAVCGRAPPERAAGMRCNDGHLPSILHTARQPRFVCSICHGSKYSMPPYIL